MATEKSRTERIATNAVFGFMAWFLPIVIGFFTTPILVHGLGNETYGLYAVIVGFITYSFSFGIGKIASKYVAEYVASGEVERISPIVSATFFFSLTLALTGTVVLAMCARFVVTDILLLSGDAVDMAVTSLYLACGISVAAMVSQVYQFVLQGVQRFGTYLMLINLNAVMLGVGNIVIILLGGGIVALFSWNIAVVLIVGAAFYISTKRFLPELRITYRIDTAALKAVAGYAASIIVYQVFANVLFIFERTYVMRRFGAEALAFYSVPMMLAIYLHAFVGSFALVLFPAVNELLGDLERQIELYKKASKIILAIVAFVFTSFVASGRQGLAVWISEEFAANSYDLLVIHTLTFGIIAVLVVVWQLAEGFKQPKINAVTTGAWLAIGVPLMIYAANAGYGTRGIASARLAGVLVTVPVLLYVEKQFLGEIFWRFWAAVVSRVALAAVAAGVIESLIVHAIRPSWTALIFSGGAGLATFLGILALTGYLTPAEKATLSGLVKSKFGMKANLA